MLWLMTAVYFLGMADSYVIDSSVYVTDVKQQVLYHLSSRSALFGPDIPNQGISGHLVYASPPNACSNISQAPRIPNNHSNWIVLIPRNGCSFIEKVRNAQRAGFVAAIVHSVDSDVLTPMSKTSGDVSIPSVYVGITSANILLRFNYSVSHEVRLEMLVFNYTKFLWPFILVLVICMSILLLFTIVKCAVNQVRKFMSRVTPSTLRKLPIKKFRKGDRYDMCAICLEEYEPGDRLRLLPCSHTFHQKCIDPWLTKNKRTCPLCKKKAFDRPGSSSRSDSDDSGDDDRTTRQTSERTPLLSAREATARQGSSIYGVLNSEPSDGNIQNIDVIGPPTSAIGNAARSSAWQLGSSVEIHRASGPDSDDDEAIVMPATGASPDLHQTNEQTSEDVPSAGVENQGLTTHESRDSFVSVPVADNVIDIGVQQHSGQPNDLTHADSIIV